MYKMNLTKCLAAIFLMEIVIASEPFASGLPPAKMVKEIKLMLTYTGWKDILDNAKTNTAGKQVGDEYVAKLIDHKDDITIENVLAVNEHITLMLNCRYSSRFLFLLYILIHLATECGYLAISPRQSVFPASPLNPCEETMVSAFKLTSVDLTHAISALMYLHKLESTRRLSSGMLIIGSSLVRHVGRLLDYLQEADPPKPLSAIRRQLLTCVSSLKPFSEQLCEYYTNNCRVETDYLDLMDNYSQVFNDVRQQFSLDQRLSYLLGNIGYVSDDITEQNFKACGFLFSSDTFMCTLRQPEASTS
ncbi:uncharacterized protein LOC126836367 isoform X2 [Adelges cooleyi]|uniref:uncharacterized protein LOC126836367 isoform X2 n=1 Tax=Adelges cooleyi TaxID=133065 RepID=UPI00218043FC|nr:uncharacterized protein LOC126836367 isoform X2 [Adelges cooleyi]